jgi:hypothetical protein
MIVWGGATDRYGLPPTVPADYLGTGARYDPVADRWTPVSGVGAPARRGAHTAVWTGTEMIVWGGENEAANGAPATLGDGARYDPAMDRWTPISAAPIDARTFHVAVWTGEEMIVWGGRLALGGLGGGAGGPEFVGGWSRDDGARYEPATDSWTTVTSDGAPSPRAHAGAVWTGEEMIVWGGAGLGNTMLSDGARYGPTDDRWTPMADYLDERADHAMIWTGTELIVWGGVSLGPGYIFRGDGARYDPATDMWAPMATPGAPEARVPYAVWTGSAVLVWGGWAPGTCCVEPLGGGGRYDPAQDAWGPLGTDSEPEARFLATTVWTGAEMVVWGGHGKRQLLEQDDGMYNWGWWNLDSGGAYLP